MASTAPTTNSRGEQVWNPAVGIYHKPGAKYSESYGGIVAALQDLIVESTGSASEKAYPANFAGIIAAIQDLDLGENKPGSGIGDTPPGSEIITGEDGRPDFIVNIPPKDGELWFDTRQGRLFVAKDEEWYQTNGADGLAFVQNDAPTKNIVQGQFWWDSDDSTGNLFIFTGTWRDARSNVFSDNPEDLAEPEPVWELVAGSDQGFQDTNTLPLANTGPRQTIPDYTSANPTSLLPNVDLNYFNVQADYNGWLFDALVNLDQAISEGSVNIGVTPPTENLVNGTLWYDTETLELSIYYIEDDGSAAWVPTSASYTFDDSLAQVTAALEQEERARQLQYHELLTAINSVNTTQDIDIDSIEQALTILETEINAVKLTMPSVTGLVSKDYVDQIKEVLEGKIAAVPQTDISHLSTKQYVDNLVSPLIIAEATHATKEELASVRAEIPSLAEYAKTSEVTQAINNITNHYLPREGGVLTNGLAWDTPYTAKEAITFVTYAPSEFTNSSFGTTNSFYELAWNFKSKEDFCWIYNDNQKVFSITKDGPACNELYLGDFSANDNNGRVMSNTIGVKSTLNNHQSGFEHIVAAAHSAQTFDQFKGYLINTLSSI